MGRGRAYTASEIAGALKDAQGLVSVAAEAIGCSRQTIYSAIEKYPTVKQALQDAREASIDKAESRLMKRIEEGSDTAIIFFLKTQGKSRGYVERKEFSGPEKGPIEIKGIDFTHFDEDD